MKQQWLLNILICALFIMPSAVKNADATIFWTETWENGTPPAGWPCKNAPTGPCNANLNYNGWLPVVADYCEGHNWAPTGVTTARAHSGTHSFMHHHEGSGPDTDSSCDIQRTFPAVTTTLYVTFWIYFDSNFVNVNTPTTEEPSTHFMFLNTAQSGTGTRINWLTKVPYTSPWTCASGIGGVPAGQPYMWWIYSDMSWQATTGAPLNCDNLISPTNLNRWRKVKFLFDNTNNRFSVWMDGIKMVNNLSMPMTHTSWYNVMFSNYFSGGSGAGYDADYYIDDITVSDTDPDAGSGGASVAQPSPPFLNP